MGDDTIEGGAGADSLAGGMGTNDIVDYSTSSDAMTMMGVTVDLSSTMAQAGADAAGDIISGFEHAIGSTLADRLSVASGGSSLLGGLGNDTLLGGGR